jgi:DNA polymerase III subunit delta
MTITVLVGDDRQAIADRINLYKSKLDPTWSSFNYHRFDCNNLEEAIDCALSVPLGDRHKVVAVDNFKFDSLSESVSELIPKIPASNYLILIASSIDRRLKTVKLLLKHAHLEEFYLIPPWRTNDLTNSIVQQAKQLKLSLSANMLDYLTTAIGNDTSRTTAELSKLAVYASNNKLTPEAVRVLVPSTTQTSLQLADAVRLGTPKLVVKLLQELLDRNEHPLVIVSTLISQFRTWSIVAEAVKQGIKSKEQIARLAKLNNPNRIYYLRQEVANISPVSLSVAYSQLFELEVKLKNGAKTDTILTTLLNIVQLVNLKRSGY